MNTLPTNLLGVFENISPSDKEKIITGWSQPRDIVSFRVNHLKSSREEITEELQKSALPYSVWEFSPDAFYLAKEHEYTLRGLEIYKTGKIYVQSLSSMIPVLCLDIQPGQKILDMTSAPGSKTTQIASILKGNCKITALEKFGIRLEKLVHTIKSQGAEDCVEVIKIDASTVASLGKEVPKAEDGNYKIPPTPLYQGGKLRSFDRIILDVPCSSDGRINLQDEKTFKWYSGEKSQSKSTIQYEMLEQARKMLADNGRIVYSTCSVSRRENEEVIQKFLKIHPEFHLLPSPIAPDYTLEDKSIGDVQKQVGQGANSGDEGSSQVSEGPSGGSAVTKSDEGFPLLRNMNRWYPSTMMEGFFVGILERR